MRFIPDALPRRFHARRVALVMGGASVLAASPVLFPADPVGAYPYSDVTLSGHGWGHGMGMGQWGALGYAVAGTPYQQVLLHYYGTLSSGAAASIGPLPNGWSDATPVTVAITANADNDVKVTSSSPFTVPGPGGTRLQLPAGSGARFQLAAPGSSNTWNVYTSSGGCGGNGNWGSPEATGIVGPTASPVTPAPFPSYDGNLANEVLQLCQTSGTEPMRGSIGGTVNSNDAARTVDVLSLGQYVADVTPSESPAYWGTVEPNDAQGQPGPQGEPWGFQELEAQAVAARSYVMSTYGNLQGWYGYADICDSTACQEYPGITYETTTGGADTAVTDTASTVVLLPGGGVAETQYSSSTGGYTAPGTFAAVPDAGDAVCLPDPPSPGACNPHHSWQAQVPVSAVQAAYPQIGTLVSVDVSERNGYGDFGGRVLQVSLVGTSQTVTMTGDVFASAFSGYGVQSDWFDVISQPSGGVSGYWIAGADGGVFSYGSAQFYGSMGGRALNQPVVGTAATPGGGGYWLVAADGGVFSFGDARFYGSTGGIRLNQPMVGMAPTPDGGGYWLVAADGGVFSFGDAPYEGSLPGSQVQATATALLPTATAAGYLVVTADGRVFPYGDAPQFGEPLSSSPAARLVGGATVTK